MSALKSTSSLAPAERLGQSISLSPSPSELRVQNQSTSQPTWDANTTSWSLLWTILLAHAALNWSCIGFCLMPCYNYKIEQGTIERAHGWGGVHIGWLVLNKRLLQVTSDGMSWKQTLKTILYPCLGRQPSEQQVYFNVEYQQAVQVSG